MKVLLLATLVTFSACKQPLQARLLAREALIDTSKRISTSDTIDKSKFYIKKDSIIITTINQDTLRFSRKDFNEIVNNFPALYSKFVEDPDVTFESNPQFKDIIDHNGDKNHISFSSENGQDEYYILYGYFLRKQFNLDKYNIERQKLTKIYTDINELYDLLNSGGTYFGHQYSRIAGYVEYAIWFNSIDQSSFGRNYNIKKQKDLYIESLRQFVKDELSENNFNPAVISPENKMSLQKDLDKLIDHISTLVSNYFYLKNAQSFQYAHY